MFDDEEWTWGRAILAGLQWFAMGLCALVLLQMAESERLRIPTHMCLDAGAPASEP